MSIAADAVSEPLWTGEVAVPDQPRHAVDYNPVTGGAGYNPHGPSGGGGAGESCAVSDLNTQSATWSDGDGAGGSCRFPTFVESWDVASLGSTCVIDLGDCPLYDLRASVSSSFEATTDHDTFLRGALPVWAAKIDALGWEDTWEAAGNALNRVSFDSYPETWGAGGLYWSGERFLWRAFRYAVATLYAYAFVVDEVPVFANAAGIDGDTIRRRFDNRGFLIDVVRVCDYQCDTLSVSSSGLVSAKRDWKAVVGLFPYAAVTPATWYCTFNDGWHLSAAIADYYFWWGLRLHDYALAGGLSSAEAGRYEILSRLCARAALAEIVDIASVLLHEFSHSTGWPGSGWECKFHQECSHFNLGW